MFKNYQNHRKYTQPKFEDTGTHTAAYTAFSKRIHMKLEIHRLFPLFVVEVKIYCMQNAAFRFNF